MYRPGGIVIHAEYGLGRFKEVFGRETRIAVVEFPDRGERFITLPTDRLTALSVRSDGLWPGVVEVLPAPA